MVLKLKCISLLVIILAEGFVPVDGLRCYNCMSTSQTACADDFKLTSSNTSYIVDKCDFCNKYHFKETDVYVRNCTPQLTNGYRFKSGCNETKGAREKVEECACGQDLCNGARSEFAAFLVIIFICLSVYSLYHLIAFDLHLT